MKHRRIAIVFGGSMALIALFALSLQVSAAPAEIDASTRSPFQNETLFPDLQCNIKVPGGLAQCGSQASSCKNCHEVKGEDPVNAQGDWHISHAFGDFCEFCHGGNVQAVDQDAAHQGLVEPLGDVKTNCSACHADFDAKAQTYAAALGVTIGSGGDEPPQPSGGSPQPTTPKATPESQAAPDSNASLPAGSQIIDYAAQYTTGSATPVSSGNVVVGILLALTVASGGAFIYWNEKRLRPANRQSPVTAKKTSAQPEAGELRLEIESELSPELAKLLPTLQSLDPRTLRALRIILADRKRGEELLQSLSLINFSVLEEMKRLDKRELSLLLALAAEA